MASLARSGSSGTPRPRPKGHAAAGAGLLGAPALELWGRMDAMSVGEELLEQRRRRRRAGDPRLSDTDREILRRVTSGDLASEFQAALDADVAADPVLGGHDHED